MHRTFALLVSLAAALGSCAEPEQAPSAPPNVLLIFADDLGYGDLGAYGATSIATPHLDRLAREGVRFTQAYSGNPVCTPSRAVVLTGRHGARQVLEGTVSGVYWPFTPNGGMSPEQVTIAELLAGAGYATSMVGKWHLGHGEAFTPIAQGFERYFGIPYSNDMAPLPLQQGELGQAPETIEDVTPLSAQAGLTGRYTQAVLEHMRDAVAAGEPFFVYHPTHVPHVPLSVPPAYAGTNPTCESLGAVRACGTYADQVSELDASIGEMLAELEALGVADRTLVIFTSDNGPWVAQGVNGGSAGGLRGGKGTTFEGGLRVPLIVRWPGVARAGAVVDDPVVAYDLFSTVLSAANVPPPADRAVDGLDLTPLLRGTGPRDPSGAPFRYLYLRSDNLTVGAYRRGDLKLKIEVTEPEVVYAPETHPELLFDLARDPGEQMDLSSTMPALATELRTEAMTHLAELMADARR